MSTQFSVADFSCCIVTAKKSVSIFAVIALRSKIHSTNKT